MAKVGERVAKVVCKLCGGQHNYRGDQQPAAAGSGSSGSTWGRPRKRRIMRANQTMPLQWSSLTPASPPRAYSPKDGYMPG